MPFLSRPDWHFQKHQEPDNSLVQPKKNTLQQHKHNKWNQIKTSIDNYKQGTSFSTKNQNLQLEHDEISMAFSRIKNPPFSLQNCNFPKLEPKHKIKNHQKNIEMVINLQKQEKLAKRASCEKQRLARGQQFA